MKWLKCIENIAESNTPGKCPYCESENTAYNATKISGNFGYAVIWCNECKNAHIISRLSIDDKIITDKKAPDNLIYT